MVSAELPDLDLLDHLEALKAFVTAQHGQLLRGHQAHQQEIEHLKLVIEKLQRMMFGVKSEKLAHRVEQLEFRLEKLQSAKAEDEVLHPSLVISKTPPAVLSLNIFRATLSITLMAKTAVQSAGVA